LHNLPDLNQNQNEIHDNTPLLQSPKSTKNPKHEIHEYEQKLNMIIQNSEIRVDSDPQLDVNMLDRELENIQQSLNDNKISKKYDNKDFFIDSGNLEKINSIIKSPDNYINNNSKDQKHQKYSEKNNSGNGNSLMRLAQSDNLLFYMNVKISEHDTYTVDVLESDSAVSVVMKAVHKHTNKYKHNINIDFDKIK